MISDFLFQIRKGNLNYEIVHGPTVFDEFTEPQQKQITIDGQRMDDGQSDPYKETTYVWELLLSGNYFAVLEIKLNLRKTLTIIKSVFFVFCTYMYLCLYCILKSIPQLGRGSGGVVVKLFAYGARGPGFDSRSRRYDFIDWLSPTSKSRYG